MLVHRLLSEVLSHASQEDSAHTVEEYGSDRREDFGAANGHFMRPMLASTTIEDQKCTFGCRCLANLDILQGSYQRMSPLALYHPLSKVQPTNHK